MNARLNVTLTGTRRYPDAPTPVRGELELFELGAGGSLVHAVFRRLTRDGRLGAPVEIKDPRFTYDPETDAAISRARFIAQAAELAGWTVAFPATDELRCPDCGETLSQIVTGAVGHSGDTCSTTNPFTPTAHPTKAGDRFTWTAGNGTVRHGQVLQDPGRKPTAAGARTLYVEVYPEPGKDGYRTWLPTASLVLAPGEDQHRETSRTDSAGARPDCGSREALHEAIRLAVADEGDAGATVTDIAAWIAGNRLGNPIPRTALYQSLADMTTAAQLVEVQTPASRKWFIASEWPPPPADPAVRFPAVDTPAEQ